MKNIEQIKARYIRYFAHRNYSKSEEKLTEQERCRCSSLAELWAYVESVVPEEHARYTIFDFDGYAITNGQGERDREWVMPTSVLISAKDTICRYCWGIGWGEVQEQRLKDSDGILKFLRQKSVMNKRAEKGNNVIVFGSSERPIGRTMVASIIMKEAIELRTTYHRRDHTYDWIDFPVLIDALTKDSLDLADYRSSNWLVVDNIQKERRSPAQATYLLDLIDPFFIERYSNNLPTILVFKFDIRNESLLMENKFGVGINRIIESKRTYRIPLSD